MPRRLMIILDGLGDCPIPALGGLTPLEAAHTPNLDRLAALGRCGMVDPLAPGVRVGTHVGAGVLMGLDPDSALHLGRGPVEAAGVGLALDEGDVALRCNLATLIERDGRLYVADRRAGRISEESSALIDEIGDMDLGHGVRATVKAATQHRAVARLSGAGLSPAVRNTDPGDSASLPAPVNPCRPDTPGASAPASLPAPARARPPGPPGDEASVRTADAVNRLVAMAYERLKDHPLNRARVARGEPPATGIITRSAGISRRLRNVLRERGQRAAVVSAESTVIGLGRLFGFTILDDPRFTATTNTDLAAKVSVVRAALANHDVVFLHVKGTDICAHDRDPEAKRDFIERIDAAIAPLIDDDTVIAVTADHTTDSNVGAHTGDPVPSLLYAPGLAPDGCKSFGETSCRRGGLARLTATRYLEAFLTAGAAPGQP